ncbi:MAG: hypothetical protein B7Z80_19830 [Rhodospirillales bacterium 20-64-7]|nr:MAG: hypothetical protein B7Z80_19830 [Rhodospirillales bacterium 20-64-7]
MTGHIATFLEWTTLDFGVILFGIQQYISVSRDLKRSKQREADAALEIINRQAKRGEPWKGSGLALKERFT